MQWPRPALPATPAAAWVAGTVIILVTVAAMWPVLGHDYVERDDPMNLFRNPAFNPPSPGALAWYWRHAEAGLYIPITYTAWAAIAAFAYDPPAAAGGGGTLDPRCFHAANLVVHLCTALAVFVLLRRLVRSDVPAAIGALVFAVHPVQVETVAWISGLKDLLAGLFSVLALVFHVEHSRAASSGTYRRATWAYAAGTLALVLALLSKPIAIVVPLMAAAIDRWLLHRRPGTVVATVVPWLVLTIPIILVGLRVHRVPEIGAQMPPHVRPIVIGHALAFHARQVFLPVRLAVDYGHSPDVIGRSALNLLWWLVPAAAGIILWMLRKRAGAVVVGAVLFVVPLLPVVGFVPFGAQLYSTVTDHYLYLPMVGVALAAAWLASVWPTRALAVAVPIILVLAARSWAQTWHWRDTVTLFQHNLQVNPRSWSSHINLAAEALVRGDPKLAERHARAAIRLRPEMGELYVNLGVALGQQGRFAEAVAPLRTAVRLAPRDAQAHYWLGEALAQVGQIEDAIVHFREALSISPTHPSARRAIERTSARQPAPPTGTPSGRQAAP